MNIFFLDKTLHECAKYHHDVHVRKMIVETAQLLSTAHHCRSINPPTGIYKPTHKNHPSAIWVRDRSGNYEWAYRLLSALCYEYTARFDKVHKTESSGCLLALYRFPDGLRWHKGDITLPPMCMPDKYKTAGLTFNDVVEAYRRYYRYAKRHDKNGKRIDKYTGRPTPSWMEG